MESYKPFTHKDHTDQPPVFQSDYVLLTGTSNTPLAEDVARRLDKPLIKSAGRFANGEINVKIDGTSVRGRKIFILNSTGYPSPNDSHMETCIIADAARRSSSDEVNAVLSNMGYSRQDRMNRRRQPISIELIFAQLEVSGVSRVITVDIHSEQSAAAPIYRKDFLYGSYILVPALKQTMPENPKFVAPDAGASGMTAAYIGLSGLEDAVIQVSKFRDPDTGVTKIVGITGDVTGADVIMPDDVVSSGKTTRDNAQYVKERGAKSVTVVSTHTELTGKGIRYLNEPWIDRLLTTDSIKHNPDILKHPKIEVYSLAPLISEAIFRTFHNYRVSELFRSIAPEEDVILLNPKPSENRRYYYISAGL